MDDFDRRLQANAGRADTLLGQPRDEAPASEAAGGAVVRLVDRDKIGEGSIMLARDLRPDRITMHVKNGIVTEAEAFNHDDAEEWCHHCPLGRRARRV